MTLRFKRKRINFQFAEVSTCMKQILLFSSVFFLFSACVKNNPKPVLLTISNWTLEVNPTIGVQDAGALTQNFTDAWVFVNNKLIGVFEVPCTIPVLASGSSNILIYPTIRNNGISATKIQYPFCEPYALEMELVAGEKYTLQPKTHYKDLCKFIIEDFEDPSLSIETDPTSTGYLSRESDPEIELSGYYGHIYLSPTDSIWIGYTTDQMNLPKAGKDVYLEIDYRNNTNLLTGVLAISSTDVAQNPNVSLNAQNDPLTWKKIYIELKEIVSFSTSAEYFEQYFRAVLDPEKTNGDIYIDNIKVVYF